MSHTDEHGSTVPMFELDRLLTAIESLNSRMGVLRARLADAEANIGHIRRHTMELLHRLQAHRIVRVAILRKDPSASTDQVDAEVARVAEAILVAQNDVSAERKVADDCKALIDDTQSDLDARVAVLQSMVGADAMDLIGATATAVCV